MEPGTSSGSAMADYRHKICINKKCKKDCKMIFPAVYPVIQFYRVKNSNLKQHKLYVCKKCHIMAFNKFNSLRNNLLQSDPTRDDEIPEFPKDYLESFIDNEEDCSDGLRILFYCYTK